MSAPETTDVEGEIVRHALDTSQVARIFGVGFSIALKEDSGRLISIRYYVPDDSGWQIYGSLRDGARIRVRAVGDVTDDKSTYEGYGVIYFL